MLRLLLPVIFSLLAMPALADESDSAAEPAPASAFDGPQPAAAETTAPPDASQAALQASMVLEAHCADVAAGTATKSARALSAVSPALTQVSEAHDATGKAFLLYWRGRLNLCLDREDRATEDLEAFVAQVGDDATYRDQAKWATRLLRVIERRSKGRATIQTPGLAAAGGALLGGAGALSGLSGWQWTVAQERLADFEDGGEPWADAEVIREEGRAALTVQRVLVASAVASGVAGLTSFVLSTVASPSRKNAVATAPAALLAPTDDGGWVLTLAGRF